VLREMGKTEEQKAALETAVRLDPNLVEARYALANLARQQGDQAASREQFAKVQQLRKAEVNRDLALGDIRAGVVLAEKHEYDAALEHFRKAITIDPRLARGAFQSGRSAAREGGCRGSHPQFPRSYPARTRMGGGPLSAWPRASPFRRPGSSAGRVPRCPEV
jgi:tetratricopeptide (TPR) repeat protein